MEEFEQCHLVLSKMTRWMNNENTVVYKGQEK